MHRAGTHFYTEARHHVYGAARALIDRLGDNSSLVRSSTIVIPILVAAIILVGCSSPSPLSGSSSHMPTNGLTQSSTGGSVAIDIEWLGTEYGLLTFAVAMNTHSVELDAYHLGEMAVLRDDLGQEYHPTSWDSGPGGHHRRGTLIFPLPDSVSQDEAKYLQLTIRDVAGVEERILIWEFE